MNRAPFPAALAQGPGNFRGLRARIGLALAALLMAASLGLSAVLARHASSSLVELASENTDALAAQTARELSAGMDRFAREIQLQATNPAFADPAATPQRLRPQLEAIQRVYPEFAHIAVVDISSAKVLAATGGIFEGGSAKGRPTFEEGVKGLFVGDVHEAVRLADLLPRPSNGEPLRFLDVAAPILGADGRAFRVLTSHLSWEWTRSVKDKVLQPIEAKRRVQIMLVDNDGRLVLPPDSTVPIGTPLAVLAGSDKPGHGARWADGIAYLSSEAPTFATGVFPGLGWRVVVRQPLSVVLASSDRLRNYFLAGGLLLGMLAAGLGWLVAGHLVKPVSDLARAASKLEPGSNLAPVPGGAASEPMEVAAVRDAFRRVTGDALHRAERLLGELDAIYQGAPVGLCVLDSELRYSRVNEVWARAFDLAADAKEGAPLAATPAPQPIVTAARTALISEAPVATDIETGQGDRARCWHVVLARLASAEGQSLGVSAVATDITEIRKAERALRLADERKNQFVSMLAHELRNPLAPIANGLEVLKRAPGGEHAARVQATMENQVRRMIRLIDDLLDISRVNLGKVTVRADRVSVNEVIGGAIDAARPSIEQRKQRLYLNIQEDLGTVTGDKVRLEQVLINLLTNASKYGCEGGWVRVAARAKDNSVLIAVEDDGRGISPEFLPHVFDLFSQEGTTMDRTEGGLGIGLSLVKNLVELHGGSVEARSEGLGKGSVFIVTLPLDMRPALATETC